MTVREGVVVIDSALVLFESGELDGYVRRGAVVIRDPRQVAGHAVDAGGGVTRQEGDRGVSLRGAPGMPTGVTRPRDQATAHPEGQTAERGSKAHAVLCRHVSGTAVSVDQRSHGPA